MSGQTIPDHQQRSAQVSHQVLVGIPMKVIGVPG
jgi:hypothetical protein